MALALFDLDRTLVGATSGSRYMWDLWRRRRVGTWFVMRGLLWLWRYRRGTLDFEAIASLGLEPFVGQRESDLRADVLRFSTRRVLPTLLRDAVAAIERHRRAGDTIAIVSSSSSYVCELVAEQVGASEVLANRVEVHDGLVTGRLLGPTCYGEGKLELAAALCARHGTRLDDAAFYTDSIADVALLRAVGRPRVVNPDRRLYREAKDRGWPVFSWSQTC